MGRINQDINKYYKEHGVILDFTIRQKLKSEKIKNKDFCSQMQDIMDPIIESFNAILEQGDNSLIVRININKLINNLLLGILTELENTEKNEEENWLFRKTEKKLVTPTITFK